MTQKLIKFPNKPIKLLPVLIAEDESIGRIEFETFDQMLGYLKTNLHAWNVSDAGRDKPGFDLREALNDIKRENDYANWDRSERARKSAKHLRVAPTLTREAILEQKQIYEDDRRKAGASNPSWGWKSALARHFSRKLKCTISPDVVSDRSRQENPNSDALARNPRKNIRGSKR